MVPQIVLESFRTVYRERGSACTLAGVHYLKGRHVQAPVLAVVSVLGKDQKGVVAQFATYMAERGINIQDIEQRVVRGFFVMDMLVDLKDITIDLSELITGLLELGRKIDMEVKVHLHSEKRKKKVALLVSKEPHCLELLIDDFRTGRAWGGGGGFFESS